MTLQALDTDALRRSLTLRDLANPADGGHALQLLVDDIIAALRAAWDCEVIVHRASPVVSIAENYDALGYPMDGAAREARYTRYVCDTALLRTSTTAMVPPLMRSLGHDMPDDVLLACPGLAYRRDCIDRLHLAEPHQMDLWRLKRGGSPLGRADMEEMIALVLSAAVPGHEWRLEPRLHPYTLDGLQIDVLHHDEWIEVGECGIAHPDIIARNLDDPCGVSGLAMGPGLDRLLMLRKDIPDVRLIRASDPRIAAQMNDLLPYRPVSAMPAVTRDLSVVVDEAALAEDLGDRVRQALGAESEIVESIEVMAETGYALLPEGAVRRLGLLPAQKNLLVRIVLRALDRTLTAEECNAYRDRIYAAIHEGPVMEWAARATI